MGSDEARFSVETDLGQQTHLWSDKYRPRKPRYFNRSVSSKTRQYHVNCAMFSW